MASYSRHWGAIQDTKQIAKGVRWITTASHGGYVLSKGALASMPAYLRACSFTKDECFEEDCSWCAVVLAYPTIAVSFDHLVAALRTAKHCYPEAHASFCEDQERWTNAADVANKFMLQTI